MTDAELRTALQSLSVGVAVVDLADWSVAFENAKFFGWFPAPVEDASANLEARMPGVALDRAMRRLEAGRPFSAELDVDASGRQVPVRVAISRLAEDDPGLALVEVHDLSGQREAEYMLDSYSKLAERHARELTKEKDRTERLLLNIMPRAVFEEMRDYGTATPAKFEAASILLLDFVGFTDMAIADDPSALVSELNDIFSAFDRIVEMFGCERLRTIGDAYMAVSGVPEENPEHAVNIARAALRLRRYIERRNQAHPQEWICRIGINTGPVIGSLVGVQKYVYDLFGPGVNLAARMETASEPMHITCNAATKALLDDEFTFTDRGDHEIKGFGTQHLYFLDGEIGETF
jgi:adenylate cyclase